MCGLWRGELTPRRAAVLAAHLPAGSGVWAALNSDRAWTAETHMLANVLDVLAGANWQRSGGDGPKPPPMPRPGDAARTTKRRSKMASLAAQYKARQQDRDGDS